MIIRPTGDGVRSGVCFTNFTYYKSYKNMSDNTNISYDMSRALSSYTFENTLNGEFKIAAAFKVASNDLNKYFADTDQPAMRISWIDGQETYTVVCGVKLLSNSIDGISKDGLVTLSMEPIHDVHGRKFSRYIAKKDIISVTKEILDITYRYFNLTPLQPTIKNSQIEASVVNVFQNESIKQWTRKQCARAIDALSNTPVFCWQTIESYNIFTLKDIMAQEPINLILVGAGQKAGYISDRLDNDTMNPTYYCMDFVQAVMEDISKRSKTENTQYQTYNSYTGEFNNLNEIEDGKIQDVVNIPINGLNERYDNSGFGTALVDCFMKTISCGWAEVDVFMSGIKIRPGALVNIAIAPDVTQQYIVFKTLVESAQDKGRQRLSMVSVDKLPTFIKSNIGRIFKPNKRVFE